jgi:Rps23 Pro-64 3,4-dihydroxylase Tpa1-like proline 4-hydroxylase
VYVIEAVGLAVVVLVAVPVGIAPPGVDVIVKVAAERVCVGGWYVIEAVGISVVGL